MIRDKMQEEMRDKRIFNQAMEYAYMYADTVQDRQVFPTPDALAQLDHFDEPMPQKVADPSEVLSTLHQHGSPATVAQIGGRYFGLVNGGVVPTALAAKWLNDFWDQNTPLYVTSPIASKIEGVVQKWLIELLDLPNETVAGFVSGTSTAILCGLAAGRFRIYQRLGWDVNEQGLRDAPEIRIVTGKHAHGTVLKAVALLGLGKSNVEYVDVDEQGRIKPEEIPPLDDRTILILQAGNVNSGSFDNFEAITTRAKLARAWVHIDGAFGLWAAGTERLKHLTTGAKIANSWSVDGHKTLNTPYDSGIVLCSDEEALIAALQATGAYIAYSDHRDGMNYTPEMSRRARAVELWATLKYLGKEGVDDLVYGLHERAVQFASELSQIEGFEVMNEVVFNQVMVKCKTDELTRKTIEKIQELRECWVGGSRWNGTQIIRISVCSWATTAADVTRSVQSFRAAYQAVTA